MAFQLSDLQSIRDAIAMGQLIVQYADKKVQYRTIPELFQAKALIEAELIASGLLAPPAVGGVERGGTTYAAYHPE